MSYKAGIYKANSDLKDRVGSSPSAIQKNIMTANPDLSWNNAVFKAALNKGVADGDLVRIKNYYKLSPEYKKKMADKITAKKHYKKKWGPGKRRASAGLPDASLYDHKRVATEHGREAMRPALRGPDSWEGQSAWGGGSMSSVTIGACLLILLAVVLYRRKK